MDAASSQPGRRVTPAARVAAAIEILDKWQAGAERLDRMLTRWGRAHRFAGSGDRHAIADLVYDAVRRLRSAAWVASTPDSRHGPVTGRALLRGSLMLDGADPAALFTGARHAPEALTEDECRPARALSDAPRGVRLDLPDWLLAELGRIDERALEAFRERAPLDLRVNLLKAARADAISALAEDGVMAEPLALAHTALRASAGQRRLAASRAYREGLVEIQDAASQAAIDLGRAAPGERVLDLCAGGGGKTLALAAAMGNHGQLVAHDIAPQRIAPLPDRAARAGARVEIRTTKELSALSGSFDLVVVDAPCSGSGAWRRNPDSKWRLEPATLDRLTEAQVMLLARAAEMAAPGGRVLYITCSLLPRENESQIDAFLARRPGWQMVATRSVTPPAGDGFFAALLTNTSNPREN